MSQATTGDRVHRAQGRVDPKIVSHRLGHTSVAFTLSIYAHALPGFDREAADEIAALVLGSGGEVVSKSVDKGDEIAPGDDLSEGDLPSSGGGI